MKEPADAHALHPSAHALQTGAHVGAAKPPFGTGAPGTVYVSHEHHELGSLRRYVFSTDHKVIGLQFMFTGLVFFLLGGLMAMAIRWQLAWPWTEMPVVGRLLFPETGRVISPEFYTMLFTMHGTIMIFFVIIPDRKSVV